MAGAQPRVFKKNLLDLDFSNVTITITDSVASDTGSSSVDFLRNRNNTSGWMTTGSSDAALTELLIEFNDEVEMDSIILVGHNIKAYTIQRWSDSDSDYVDFSTAISVTDNAKDTTAHYFDLVSISKFKIIIQGTQTADEDKRISQLIAAEQIESGKFKGWPDFSKPTLDFSKKKKETLSGKVHVSQSTGAYKTKLSFRKWPESDDIKILSSLFFKQYLGFLFWPCGGDEDQFRHSVDGFRLRDIYHCRVTSEWNPEWDQALYQSGVNINVEIMETI